jgi:pimeloyl-ACP methyl ester carboxylesterase
MKKLLLTLLLLTTVFNGLAQNNSYANRMQHIFGNIDKTKVTTGYLKEFGVRFANMEACNGSLSTNNFVTKSEWQALYSSLYSMRVGQVATTMASPQTVNNNLKTQQNNTDDILIAVQHYKYQQYKTNAHTNGDVVISNDRIYDLAGRNPYEVKTVFAIAPLKQQIQGSTFTFQLPSNLLYSNTSATINQIQIDYGNGQGYQTVSQNQRKSVSYNSGGEKEIKVKFAYNNGTTLISHSKVWLNYVASRKNFQARFNGNGFLNENGTLWFNNLVTGSAWDGSSANGRVTIELAPGHTQLTKPIIIIEGFDPEDSFNYFDLIDDAGPGGLDIRISQPGEPFLTLNQAIEDEDYDLIFVDFVNSTDFIQRNAYMVEEVIRQINQLKVGNEKNVVLGMSMGGLVGRYALRHMEIEDETHDTKLYVSHDSPHQGANVPLAAQALVRHLIGEEISLPVFFSLFNVNILDLEDNFPELSEGLALLQSPAAQQMLVYQLQGTGDGVSIDNTTLQASFLNEYKAMGYPQQNGIRNIAIANGTECGNPLDFNPYDHIVNANIEVDLPFFLTNIALAIINGVSINPLKFLSSLLSTNTDVKAQFTLRALPSLQSKQIYRGRLYIKKTILFLITVHEPLIDEETVNSGSNMLALDNANGGIYDIENFAELPTEFEQYVQQRRFNFIPAYSSLDVGSGNETINPSDLVKNYNPTSPPQAPKDIPFDNFFTNPIISEAHIQFTLNNGQWLTSEIADSPEVLSCAFACGDDSSISGVNQFCTGSRTFSVPIGADTYQWQAFPDPIPMTDTPLTGNISIISTTNTNSITLNHTGNRSGW